jgi:hypothetical protein
VNPHRVPWEDPEVSFPANLGLAWWESLTRPAAFYARVDGNASLSRPILYWLLLWVAAGMLSLLWAPPDLEGLLVTVFGEGAAPDTREFQLFSFFLSPFVALAVLGAGTLVHHGVAVAVAARHGRMADTARVVCYAVSPIVLAALPVPRFLGPFWSLGVAAWTAALLVSGFRHAHATSTGRALVIALLPGAVVLSLAVLVTVAMVAVMSTLPDLPL